MADKNQQSVFSGVLDAIKGNRKAPNPSIAGGTAGPRQGMPQLDPSVGVENMQQDFLDWQVHKISHDLYTRTVYFDTDRISAYQDFRAMDNTPEIATALNIMRDECLTRGEAGDILEIYSENDRAKQVLEDLFRNVLQIEFNLRLWIRDLIKFGDYMVFLVIDKDVGIYDFQTLPVEECHREEGYDGTTNSVRFRWETTGDYFEEWQIAHFRLLEDTKKLPYGRCLKYDTYIETKDGVKFIKDIQKGDFVYSFNVETQKKEKTKVLDVVCSGKKEIYKIRTKHHELEASEEHKILVYNNNEFIYKNVCDLNIKDLLVINKEVSTNDNIKINKKFDDTKNFNGYRNGINLIPEYVDEDFARLFGFLLGDGWINNNSVDIALGVDEEINEKYIKLLEKFSGKQIKFSRPKNKKGLLEFSQAKVNSKMLSEVLQNNGFIGNVYNKRLPKWVFTASKNIQKALIDGLIDADGSKNIDKWNCIRYSLELANEYLIKDVKTLLQRLGIKVGKICSRDRGITKIWGEEFKTKKSYYIYFYDSKIKQIEKYDVKNRVSDNFIITPLIAIEKQEEESETFDIYVENKNHNFYANGIVVHNSMLDPARKLWKQLQLAEDAMLVYRITRAPERRIFYIEVGNLPDADVKTYVSKVQQTLKKQPIVDQRTGNINYKFDPKNVTEDYYIPIRGDKSSKIETLPGASNLGEIQDIEYLQNKLFTAIQVPKTYLNYAEALPGGSTLSQTDLRFSRTINSIQEAILLELRRIANVHLYFLGFEDAIDNFKLTLTNPSTQQELLKLETMKARLEVFKEFFSAEATSPTSYTWAMEQILGFSKHEIKHILKQKKVEKKLFAEIESAVETYKKIGLFDEIDKRFEDPEAAARLAAEGGEGGEEGEGDMGGGGGGGLGGLGGGLSGGMDMGGEEMPGEEGGAEGAPSDEEGGAPPEEEELAERRRVKRDKLLKESDKKIDFLIDNLLDETEKVKTKKESEIIKGSSKLKGDTKRLMEKMQKKLEGVDTKQKKVEEKPKASQSKLLENNESMIKKSNSLFAGIDKLIEENGDE